jgi:hypothetical protein
MPPAGRGRPTLWRWDPAASHRNLASPIPDVMWLCYGGRPGALPMAEQERRLFLLILAFL